MASLLTGQTSQPKVRNILTNGVRVYVESTKQAQRMSVVLAANATGLGSSPENHGWLHLYEHLVVKGKDGTLDHRLESLGMTLLATTNRDAMVIEITGRPEQFPVAIAALQEITQPITPTEDDIKKETATIDEELAILGSRARLAKAGWDAVFGAESPDPYGTIEKIALAKPEDMTEIGKKLFSGKGISIAAVGDIQADIAAARIKDAFSKIAAGEPKEIPVRSTQEVKGLKVANGARGEGRAVVCEGIDGTTGLATLGAGIVIASALSGVEPVFTPSTLRGTVTLYSPSKGTLAQIDSWSAGQRQSLSESIPWYLLAWTKGIRSSTSKYASFCATTALQNPNLSLDQVEALVKSITPADCESAISSFRFEQSIILEGGS